MIAYFGPCADEQKDSDTALPEIPPLRRKVSHAKPKAEPPAVKFGDPLLADHFRGDDGAYLNHFKGFPPDQREAAIKAGRRHIPPGPSEARELFNRRMAALEGADNSLRLGHRP